MKPLDEIIDENFVLRLSRGEPWAFEGQLEDKDGNVEPLAGRTFFGCVMAADGTRLREAVAEIYTDSTGVFYRGVIDGSMSDDLFGQSNLLWWQGERTDAGNKPDAQGSLVIYPGPGIATPVGPSGIATVATRFIRRATETGRARIRKAQAGARGPSPWDAEGETLEAYNARVAQGAVDLAAEQVGAAITELGETTSQKFAEVDDAIAGIEPVLNAAIRTDTAAQPLTPAQRRNARVNADTPSTGEVRSAAGSLRSQLIGTIVPDFMPAVRTAGGEVVGDGEAVYRVVDADPGHAGKVALAGGKYLELASPPTPLNTGIRDAASLRRLQRDIGQVAKPHLFDHVIDRNVRRAVLADTEAQAVINPFAARAVDRDAFATAMQQAFDRSVEDTLLIPTGGYQMIRPLSVDSRADIRSSGHACAYGGATFYPALDIDWKHTFPRRGLIETRNSQWPTGYPAGSAKPDYWGFANLERLLIRCHFDRRYLTNPQFVPDYGFFIWAPNEETTLRKCSVMSAGRSGFYFGGYLSVLQVEDCSSFGSGEKQDTTFGDLVTRPAKPLTGQVSVYTPHNTIASATQIVTMEAATADELTQIVAGDVLRINGDDYTVASYAGTDVYAAPVQITQRTQIAGVITTTRWYRHVPVNEAVKRFMGRVFHWGFSFGNHPDRGFAPGISGPNGGQSSGGSARLYGYSGDYNRDALAGIEGAHIIEASGGKAENHPSLWDIVGNAVGNARPRLGPSGTRVEHGTTGTLEQGAVIRILGSCRPTIAWMAIGTYNQTWFIEDRTPLGTTNQWGKAQITVAEAGGGMGLYCVDNSEGFSAPTLFTGAAKVAGALTVQNLSASGSLNYRVDVSVRFSTVDTVAHTVGGGFDRYLTVNGTRANQPGGVTLWGFNAVKAVQAGVGTGTEPAIRLEDRAVSVAVSGQNLGFGGAVPIPKPAVAGSRNGNAALGSLIAALAALGLVTDTTS